MQPPAHTACHCRRGNVSPYKAPILVRAIVVESLQACGLYAYMSTIFQITLHGGFNFGSMMQDDVRIACQPAHLLWGR